MIEPNSVTPAPRIANRALSGMTVASWAESAMQGNSTRHSVRYSRSASRKAPGPKRKACQTLLTTVGRITAATATCAESAEPIPDTAIIGKAKPTAPLVNPATNITAKAKRIAAAPNSSDRPESASNIPAS